MGYLSDRDLNREFGFSSRERPSKDYLGGREGRNFERPHVGGTGRSPQSSEAPPISELDYLGINEKREELSRLANFGMAPQLGKGSLGQTYIPPGTAVSQPPSESEEAKSDAEIAAGKVAVKVARIALAIYVAGKYGAKWGARVAGGAVGGFVGVIFAPSEIACGEGEKCGK